MFLENVRERLIIVALGDEKYVEMLRHAPEIGVVGGGIYDVIHWEFNIS